MCLDTSFVTLGKTLFCSFANSLYLVLKADHDQEEIKVHFYLFQKTSEGKCEFALYLMMICITSNFATLRRILFFSYALILAGHDIKIFTILIF